MFLGGFVSLRKKEKYNRKDFLPVFGLILLISIFAEMTPDARLERNHQSYFKNDVQEDLVVELFTQNQPIQAGTTKNTKFISYTTSEKLYERESEELLKFIKNYINNVGGEILYLNDSVSYRSSLFFPSKKVVVRNINCKVPDDAPFIDDLENILEKFFAHRDYTLKRYNSRHDLER